MRTHHLSCGVYQLLIVLLLVSCLKRSQSVDKSSDEVVVAFGSCNRQNKPQEHWDFIKTTKPDLFIWTGDSVYAKDNTLAGLEVAFKNLSGNLLYDNFKKEVEIDGIWDDHDMGINDGGKHVNKIRERQDMFINYITGDKRSLNTSDGGKTEIIDGEEYFNTDSGIKARESSENNLKNEERRRDDLSKVIDKKFGKNGPNVRFILLDTRSHRDNHYIKSLGEIKLPLTPLIAAFVRASYSVMGLGREHEGTILGENQWKWLESTLAESTADFHVVISSIQIFTSNPVVESWGHFPAEKERLVNLMKKIDPSGLVFLSGDVHHGELSKARIVRERGESLWVEITSSGMTHTCGDSMFNSVLCPKMLETFSEHRLQSRGPPNVEEETPLLTTDTSQRNTAKNENYYIGKNFGLITDSSNSTMYALNFTVIGIDSKKTELNYIVQSIRRNCRKKNSDEFTDIGIEQDADSREYSCFPDPIMTVEVADFPLFIREEVKKKAQEILGAVLLAMLFYFLVCSFTFYVKKRQ